MKKPPLLITVLTVAAGGLAPGAAASSSGPAVLATPQLATESSAVRCHLELEVRLAGGRFRSSHGTGVVTCSGTLLGMPVTEAAVVSATGIARHLHHGAGLPPVFGATQLSLHAVGPEIPFAHRDSTRVRLALAPSHLATPGAGHFTGTTRIRGHHHQASATMAFTPAVVRGARRCCRSGKLIIDLTLWGVG